MIGGNLGDREKLLQEAENRISQTCGAILNASSVYESEAWGMNNQPSFLNKVLVVNTLFSPEELLERTQQIENLLERKRLVKWGPRTMDIDLLFYNDQILQSALLTVPHPWICKRRFVLEPLVEVAAQMLHPIEQLTMEELLGKCEDPCSVIRWATR